MRRLIVLSSAVLMLVVALTGCGQKQTTAESTASSDSLLASNPVEQPSGSITPQQNMNPPQAATEPAPETSTPAKTAATHPKTKTVSRSSAPAANPGVKVDAGTALSISVSTQLSSETANVGDTWTGEVKENVIVGDRVVFPAGSMVSGVITESVPAKAGDRAKLGLAVTAITVNGNKTAVDAGSEELVAGSTRARNVGGVVGGAAAGALIGKAVGGGKGALIGGLLGGGAGATAAARSKGYQVTVKEGAVMTFTVKAPVTVRS